MIDFESWRGRTGLDAASKLVTGPADVLGEAFAPRGPALDGATAPTAPAVDLCGRARPVGAAADIGALEACAGASCQPIAPIRGTKGLAEAPRVDTLLDVDASAGGCASCAIGGPSAPPPFELLLAVAPLGWSRRRKSG